MVGCVLLLGCCVCCWKSTAAVQCGGRGKTVTLLLLSTEKGDRGQHGTSSALRGFVESCEFGWWEQDMGGRLPIAWFVIL